MMNSVKENKANSSSFSKKKIEFKELTENMR